MWIDGFLLLYFLGALPKFLWERFYCGKQFAPLARRLSPPKLFTEGREVLWIHAVSVGEVKAAQPLFDRLREEFPQAFFFITTTTVTGQAEARRSLPKADAIAYLPLDFRWVVRRWVALLRPKVLLFIESDVWPNLLCAVKEAGGKAALISAKISARSAKRFHRFLPFAKRFFSKLDLLCVQDAEMQGRFRPLVAPSIPLLVTGNLKLDQRPEPLRDSSRWKELLNLSQPALALTCTHPGEEELLLDQLIALDLFLFLAPRHPERFEEVALLLQKKKIPFLRWSCFTKRGAERVLLVDAMGQLPLFYSLSRLTLLGGSFVRGFGGHNPFEPCLYGTPVFFGPHMAAQQELAKRLLDAKAAKQVPLEHLREEVDSFFKNPSLEAALRQSALAVVEENRGAVEKTLEALQPLFGKTFREKDLGVNHLSC